MNHELQQDLETIAVHYYHSVVTRTVSSISAFPKLNLFNNPRFKDIAETLSNKTEDELLLILKCIVATAEYTAYRALDFIENYTAFYDENNTKDYPSLSLNFVKHETTTCEITAIGHDNLGDEFLKVAKSAEMRNLVNKHLQDMIDANA